MASFKRLTDHWCERHPTYREGRKFQKFDGVVLAELWKRVGEDLEWATGTVDAYLADRNPRFEGHPANLFKLDMDKFIARAKAGAGGISHAAQGNGTRGSVAAHRGRSEQLSI